MHPPRPCRPHQTTWENGLISADGPEGGLPMSKRARKRRDRNKKGANHGKKPNT